MFRKSKKQEKNKPYRIDVIETKEITSIQIFLTGDWKLWFSNPITEYNTYSSLTNGQIRQYQLVDEFRQTIESFYKEEK